MSRSYKKPFTTLGYGGNPRKFYKRYANKKVRRVKGEITDGKSYVKHGDCSWKICDGKKYTGDFEDGYKVVVK